MPLPKTAGSVKRASKDNDVATSLIEEVAKRLINEELHRTIRRVMQDRVEEEVENYFDTHPDAIVLSDTRLFEEVTKVLRGGMVKNAVEDYLPEVIEDSIESALVNIFSDGGELSLEGAVEKAVVAFLRNKIVKHS